MKKVKVQVKNTKTQEKFDTTTNLDAILLDPNFDDQDYSDVFRSLSKGSDDMNWDESYYQE